MLEEGAVGGQDRAPPRRGRDLEGAEPPVGHPLGHGADRMGGPQRQGDHPCRHHDHTEGKGEDARSGREGTWNPRRISGAADRTRRMALRATARIDRGHLRAQAPIPWGAGRRFR